MENDPRDRRPSSPKGAPKGWSISKAEAKRLLAEEKWEQDPTDVSFAYTAYVSDLGELLLFMTHGRSVLYASRAEVIANEEKMSKLPQSIHVLEGLLPQGPQFIEAVPGLVDALAKQLKIPRESLDCSFGSLELVENALLKIRPRKRILEIPNLFAGIVAYTGEVMRKLSGGYWKLNEVPGGIWEPYVHTDEHHYMNPFLDPYKDIAEVRRGGVMLRPLVVASLSVPYPVTLRAPP